ncbi:MAG: 30S ribosomal protein S8 [Planctomycetes bacterium]|nr:30S ribosomal protein S8 [Planctomycetota bacterium]
MMTDPIADMLTRIRNAIRIEKPDVRFPASRVKAGIAQVLKDEGYVWDWEFEQSSPVALLRVHLKYGPQGERVIRRIDRVSKPGCRVYQKCKDLKPVLDGMGICVLSTSKGVMSDRQARARKLGGEVICRIW